MHTSLRDRPILPAGPPADCTADSAGGLTFDVDLPGRRDRWDAALLLRLRGADRSAAADGPDAEEAGEAEDDCVRLPLFPVARGRLRAALPSTMTLAEGHWEVLLVLGDGAPRPLRSGRHDLRSLVDREPSAHRGRLGVRIPYSTPDDRLGLRAWLRRPHAEVGDLRFADGALSLRGRLYGAELSPQARLEARPREATREPVTVSAAAGSAGGGSGFRCTLPLAALTGPGEWEVWLRPAEAAPAVRLARLLDDVAEKRDLVPHPPYRHGDRTVSAYWTDDNALGVRLDHAGG